MKFLGSATISAKNQITIPSNVVKTLELERGDQLLFLLDEDGNLYVTTEVTLPQKKD